MSAVSDEDAREETTRVARLELLRAREGLRPLELIASIAPLLGLLGTVLGMIEAFQALQESGNRADPAALAGGIWEALLTTAAGMAVAIPAGVALSWFEAVADRVQADLEDGATRIFTRVKEAQVMFDLAPPRPRRRISLTPMIDVVFLLLVFFMLAARFGQDLQIPLSLGQGSGTWQGPPRLLDIRPDGLMLNGVSGSLPEDSGRP